jgi:hypothetical protein
MAATGGNGPLRYGRTKDNMTSQLLASQVLVAQALEFQDLESHVFADHLAPVGVEALTRDGRPA